MIALYYIIYLFILIGVLAVSFLMFRSVYLYLMYRQYIKLLVLEAKEFKADGDFRVHWYIEKRISFKEFLCQR